MGSEFPKDAVLELAKAETPTKDMAMEVAQDGERFFKEVVVPCRRRNGEQHPEGTIVEGWYRSLAWVRKHNSEVAVANRVAKPADKQEALVAPTLEEIFRAEYPHLICTEAGEKDVEWFVGSEETKQWNAVVNLRNLVHAVDHKMGNETEGCRRRVADVIAGLQSMRAVKNLAREKEMRISGRVAAPIERKIIPCRTVVLMMGSGKWEAAPYSLDLFALNRLIYDPQADCSIDAVMKVMTKAVGEDKIDAWMDWMAYCLTPGNPQKKIMMLLGDGDSGKTTLGKIINELLASEDPLVKNVDYLNGREITDRTRLAGVRGARLVISEEACGYGSEFEEVAKAISGGSPVDYNIKYGASGSYLPGWKMMFSLNDAPTWIDESGALAKRHIVLRCTNVLAKSEQKEWDVLREELVPCMPGLLYALLPRCLTIRARGCLTIPEASAQAVLEIQTNSDTVSQFIVERCVEGDRGDEETTDKLYLAYRDWCVRSGQKEKSKNIFIRRLVKKCKRWKAFGNRQANHGKCGVVWGLKLLEGRADEFNTMLEMRVAAESAPDEAWKR